MKYFVFKADYNDGICYGTTYEEYDNFDEAYYHYMNDFHVIDLICGVKFNLDKKLFDTRYER